MHSGISWMWAVRWGCLYWECKDRKLTHWGRPGWIHWKDPWVDRLILPWTPASVPAYTPPPPHAPDKPQLLLRLDSFTLDLEAMCVLWVCAGTYKALFQNLVSRLLQTLFTLRQRPYFKGTDSLGTWIENVQGAIPHTQTAHSTCPSNL